MKRNSLFVHLLLTALIISAGFISANIISNSNNAVIRNFPNTYTPENPLTLTLDVNPSAETIQWGVQETPPEGWIISDISHGGSFYNGTISWLSDLNGGNQPVVLSYTATPLSGETGLKIFYGKYGYFTDGYQEISISKYSAICDRSIIFNYVPRDHWAYDYIYAIACAGITTGYGDGTYRPTNQVNRAQMAIFIIRAFYGDDFSYGSAPYFPDVLDTHWAFKYIQRMYEEGIATGYGDGTYKPLRSVNRAQMAILIIRALHGEDFEYSATPHFPDVPADHWAFKYIQKMYEYGISTGYSDGTYKPSRIVNRAQMAVFIARGFLGME
jgi:hypothetical protein